ncbi:MAG: hypothetical protein ACKOBV_10355, partial [Candidatus Kapaibacterium sp.]
MRQTLPATLPMPVMMSLREIISLLMFLGTFLIAGRTVHAQRAVLRSLDLSGYPVVRASLYAFDGSGAPVLPDTTRDRRVIDNGTRQTLGTVRYDVPPTPRPFGMTFLADATSPSLPKALAAALGSWDAGIDVDHDASLVAFGALPYVVRDVGQASLTLRDAVVRFPLLGGGRDVTSAMLDSLCGAIAVSRRDTRARGIVLITDVQSSLPADSVLRALRDAGSRLFVLTLDACASASMRAVAHASGGVCMDSVPVAALGAALRACAF